MTHIYFLYLIYHSSHYLSIFSDSLEWLDPSVAEKSYFLIPILDGSCPICLGAINALLVDEKILPGLEPIDLTALCTVMCKVALISMFLGHASQFIIPLLMKKMAFLMFSHLFDYVFALKGTLKQSRKGK